MIRFRLKLWEYVVIRWPNHEVTVLTKSTLDFIRDNSDPESFKLFAVRRLAGKLYIAWRVS